MNVLLPILIVAIGLDASTQDRYPEATQVFHCEFGRSWDENYDDWPDGWTRRRGPGFPRYVKIHITGEAPRRESAAGPRCLRIDLDGSGAVAYSPPIEIGPFYGYVVQSYLRTEGLEHNRAFLSLTLLDADRCRLETYYSQTIGNSQGWKKLRLGPVSPRSENVRQAVIGLHLEPGNRVDMHGTALFDDIYLGRLPRMSLSANSPHHVYCRSDKVEITCRASGFANKNQVVTFLLEDAWGHRLARVERLLKTNAVTSSGPKKGPGLICAKHPPGRSGKLNLVPFSATTTWEPPVAGPGFYRVRAMMKGHEASPHRHELTLAVVQPRRASPDSEFGWTLSHGGKPLPITPLGQLIGQVGISRLKYPLWYDEKPDGAEKGTRFNLPERPGGCFAQIKPGPFFGPAPDVVEKLIAFGECLDEQGIELVGILNRPPRELRKQYAKSKSLLAAEIFSPDPEVWYPSLEPVMTRLATRVRYWQLGQDMDTSFVGYLNLSEKLTQVKAELDRIGQGVKLGIGWGWMNELPEAAGGKGPCGFLALSAEPPLTHKELGTHLDATKGANLQRWVALVALPRGQHPLETRTVDLVRRMMTAKIHGAEGIYFAEPFGTSRGLMNDDGTPGELLLPWRTVALALGGTEYLGSITLPRGSQNHVFARSGSAVMVVWNEKPTEEVIYLGEQVRQVDLWGRGTVPAVREHRQVIEVGPLPSLVAGLNEPIARWRMDFAFTHDRIPSIFGQRHQNGFCLKNHFPPRHLESGAVGRAKLITPDVWKVDPKEVPFQLADGERRKYNFEIMLPYNASSGRHEIRVDFDIKAQKEYRFSVYRRMDVGLGDVRFDIVTQLSDAGELEVRQRMVNKTDKPVSFRCQLFAPDRQRMKTQIIGLKQGSDLKTYRIPKGKELIGKTLWLRAEEMDSPRMFNYRFTAAE